MDWCRAHCGKVLPTRCCSDRKSYGSKATPFPLLKVLVVGSVLLTSCLGSLLTFPFLAFMVQDFFPELSTEELGQKVGLLDGMFYLGGLLTGLLWGWLSDHWGRRPVMMLGLCGSIFSQLLFGFSQNYTWAACARFLWGALNGNMTVAKAYLTEVCDNTNLAKGYAVVGVTGAVGRLLGSFLGGFLAQPASKYAVFEHPFFCQFQYLLPCLCGAILSLAALIAACLIMEETLHKGRFSHDYIKLHNSNHELTNHNAGSDDTDSDATDNEMTTSLSNNANNDVSASTELLTNHDHIAESDVASESDARGRCGWITRCLHSFFRQQKRQCLECCWCCECTGKDDANDESSHAHQQASPTSCKDCLQVMYGIALSVFNGAKRLKLLLDRRVFLAVVLNAMLALLIVSIYELIPLLFINDEEHGGFGMDTTELGVLALVASVLEFLFQMLIFPPLARLLGFRITYRIGITVFVIACVLVPFSSTIVSPIYSYEIDVTSGYNVTSSGNGSGLWEGSGFNSLDYCGEDTGGSESNVNENSITRLPLLVWVMAEGAFMCVSVAYLLGLTSSMVLIGNSSLPESLGTVNGIAQTASTLLMALGPTLSSIGLAWSEENTDEGYGWPLNYNFPFVIFALVALTALFISIFLPKSIEKKRDK